MPLRKFIIKNIVFIIKKEIYIKTIEYSFYVIIFVLSIMELAQATYNPFIYFRF